MLIAFIVSLSFNAVLLWALNAALERGDVLRNERDTLKAALDREKFLNQKFDGSRQ